MATASRFAKDDASLLNDEVSIGLGDDIWSNNKFRTDAKLKILYFDRGWLITSKGNLFERILSDVYCSASQNKSAPSLLI